jgi:predicted histidine transporter YuiF (NhaC family)
VGMTEGRKTLLSYLLLGAIALLVLYYGVGI